MLDTVRHLVDAGFAIHRLHPKSKRPIGDDWSTKPFLSFDQLKRIYRDGENLGVRLGQWSKVGGGFLHALDLDIRDRKLAGEARAKLGELFPGWKEMPTVASGSGGESRHIYFLSDKHFPSTKLAHSAEKIEGPDGTKHWAWEIELFGTGKQVALPPSIHPDTGRPYIWTKRFDFSALELGIGPFVPAETIEELIGADDEDALDPEKQQPLGLSVDEIRELLDEIPNDDLDYDEWLNVMASVQHEAFGREEEERKAIFEVFRAWSARSKKHDDRTCRYKFFSFKNKESRRHRTMRSIQAEVRELRLEAEFDNLEDEFDDLGDMPDIGEEDEPEGDNSIIDDLLGLSAAPRKEVTKRQQKLNKADVEQKLGFVPPKVARINKKHAVAFINGKTVIVTENKDGSVSYGTVGDLHNFYENDRVATEKATEPLTKAWLRHKARREYPNGVVFAPGEDVEGAYNHWRGFAVEPSKRGSCKLILKHIRAIICRGDETANTYFVGWLAHMIQKPWEKPGVAVVLRGEKGTGKDTIGDYVGGLFPHHHVKIANQEHMVGRFNAHQEKCLMLHVEEGFWAGNKQAEGMLKHLITSEKVLIEPKGLNGFHVKSVLRLFMSSNEKWVVPASEDERRYFVLDVDPRFSRKRSDDETRDAYFDAIRQEMLNGGREALLHYLQNYDLSDFNVRAVPNTAALADQKLQGLRNIERWWHGQLQSGEPDFPCFHEERAGDWPRETISADRREFRDAYSRWMRSRRYDGEELRDVDIGKHLRAMCPEVRETRPNSGGGGARPRTYQFPMLETCRRAFEVWIGSELEWPDDLPDPPSDEYDDLLH